MRIEFMENQIYVVFEIDDQNNLLLLHMSSIPYIEESIKQQSKKWFRCVELQMSGKNQNDHHGAKYTGTSPGTDLRYIKHNDYRNEYGRKLELITGDGDILAISHYQFYDHISVVRSWTEVETLTEKNCGLEYISSFALTGLNKEDLKDNYGNYNLHIPHNSWCGEVQWRKNSLLELGLSKVFDFSTKRISISNTGTWSSNDFLPMGGVVNCDNERTILWQIEHNGSWHYEISDIAGYLYMQLSGPTENESHWYLERNKGEKFVSVPVAITFCNNGFDNAIGEMTKYRRIIRRKNKDNEKLPVIFNDYMNCLSGDPTTEKLKPLVVAAATAGCEYFCIDAGWYSDGFWWNNVGEWVPSEKRFPGGIQEIIQYIKDNGMTPGLWLELEVMGTACPLVKKVSSNWFFKRHGKLVIDHERYQLDFRNPEVIDHANAVIERLVLDYGIGYIKMDYNINAGIGTEIDADSFGSGLLEHNRSYLNWIDNIFKRYPDLVIENCGSGGLRADYAMLARHSIQSISDQTDYRKNAVIAAASLTAVTPEQCAVWSYPLIDGDNEEVIFNMINAMLMRIHQSGHLAQISKERFDIVKEAIEYYKKIRIFIPTSIPFWPIGIPVFNDQWACLGLKSKNKIFLAVWKFQPIDHRVSIPLSVLKNKKIDISCTFPGENTCKYNWGVDRDILEIEVEGDYRARLFEITISGEELQLK